MPLKCYDVVLGMEWSESFSPIEVHLSQKWLSFLHSGSKIKLQGLTEELCTVKEQVDTQWPQEIQLLANRFSELFEPPKQLPPHRSQLALHNPFGDYNLQNGVIKFKGRILVPDDPDIQSNIMQALHASPIGGHSGFHVTYHKIRRFFFWHKMKSMVKRFVASCSVCIQAKAERVAYPGLLQPLPVPDHAWQVISMDFIEGLPRSHQYDCILVVVDTFSKYAHFIPLSHPFTAANVAKLFMENVFKLHGFPHSIISDRDRVFTSQFWQELFKLVGTTLRLSSAYHPQSDGQTERVNQCLETYLRCFVHACPAQWKEWLHLAEFWYNTSFHSSLSKTPFEVLKVMVQLLQQHLARVQLKYKKQADKKRTDRQFEVGDSVFLKIQPYVQSSLIKIANHKLSFRYFGPFKILERIGVVAYRLDLPPTSNIHPVFHVSLIRADPKSGCTVTSELPNLTAEAQEEESKLRQLFPRSPAWGQAVSEEQGDVTGQVSSSNKHASKWRLKPNTRFANPEWK
ncbi:hypothetical protein U9M48_031036, partial [Paspalum notatum var. saurae]